MSRNAQAFRELAAFRMKIETLPEIQTKMSRAMAKETLRQIRIQFKQSKDPFGKPWKATKAGNKPLIGKTKKLRSFRVDYANANGFALSTKGSAYLRFHNRGTRAIPKRQVTVSGKIPKAWLRAYQTIARHLYRKHFR